MGSIACTLSVYLKYVLLWPDDGRVTGETFCVEVKHRIFYLYILTLYVVFLHGNKTKHYKYTFTNQ
jgi:hypothetical protein